jgi:hypothetical protein
MGQNIADRTATVYSRAAAAAESALLDDKLKLINQPPPVGACEKSFSG